MTIRSIISIIALATAVVVAGCSEQKTEAPKVEKVAIAIPTSKCTTCQRTITKAVKKVDGVNTVDVDGEKHVATVEFVSATTTQGAIEQAISNAGYDANNVKRNEDAYNKLPECCK